MKILIVDDDAEIRTLIGQFLSKYGYEMTLACDGKEMFAALCEGAFDLIILDIMMPVQDGISILKEMKGNPETAPIPVVILSAKGQEKDVVKGLELGASDYIAKPFAPSELIARIKRILS